MRVLLADDDPQVCRALRLVLQCEPGLTVIGEVASVAALQRVIAEALPDLVLLDWELPDGAMDPADVLADLRARAPGLQVVVLSSQPEAAQAARLARADVFVSKADPPEELLAALRTFAVMLGQQDSLTWLR